MTQDSLSTNTTSKDGHWRNLPSHYKGHGPDGGIVYGRTWVDRKAKVEEEEKKEEEVIAGETTSEKDLRLWKRWKSDPSKENLLALMNNLNPLINRWVNEYKDAAVPESVIRGAAQAATVKGIRTYNPEKAALGTHVFNHLRKIHSTVAKYQNFGRIPEHRAGKKVRLYKNAVSELEERIGHSPSDSLVAEELTWSEAEVGRMRSELKKDLIASQNLEADTLPEIYADYSRERQVLRYIHQDLTEEEKVVFEHTIGINGKEELSAGAIAKKMGISRPKVSRIRKKISTKLAERGI